MREVLNEDGTRKTITMRDATPKPKMQASASTETVSAVVRKATVQRPRAWASTGHATVPSATVRTLDPQPFRASSGAVQPRRPRGTSAKAKAKASASTANAAKDKEASAAALAKAQAARASKHMYR